MSMIPPRDDAPNAFLRHVRLDGREVVRRLLVTCAVLILALLALGVLWCSWGWRHWPRVEAFDAPAILKLDIPFVPAFDSAPESPSDARQVEQALLEPIVKVTEKTHLSPRGNARDYVSLSIYWWPNSITGVPWIHRDGKRNPAAGDYDAPRLQKMTRTVRVLASANRPNCQARAREWLRAWFIDAKTAMNPHLTFAQMMPGIAAGGRQGIIEGLPLVTELLDAIAWLDAGGALTQEDRQSLRRWFGSYLQWLMQSRPGRSEAARANNHGTWHDAQIVAITRSLSLDEITRNVLESARIRLTAQFLPDGRQPEELRRSKSFSYSLYNLSAWIRLERLGQSQGITFWQHGPDCGLRYLETHQKAWPHADLERDHANALAHFMSLKKRWEIGSSDE